MYGKKPYFLHKLLCPLFFSILVLTGCGRVINPFINSSSDQGSLEGTIELPINFVGGLSGFNLATALSNVYLSVSGCTSGYTQTNFLFNGSTVRFYLNDTNCLLSVCSFTYNSENYPNASPPCTFNTTAGTLTTYTGTGGANPGGDVAYVYVAQQIQSPITASSSAEFYVLQNDAFSNFNLPISTTVLNLQNSSPASAPYTVADSTASVSFLFKMLYPNPPPSTATTVNYTMIGSAVAGTDYTAPSGTLTIPANNSSATLTVNLINNTTLRETQSLGVIINSSTGFQGNASYVAYGQPSVMITNSDSLPGSAANPGRVYQGTPTNFTTSGSFVTGWNDGSGSGLGATFTQSAASSLILDTTTFSGFNAVDFNGSNYLRLTSTNTAINNAAFTSKVISMVFKTTTDVTTQQVLYQQGDNTSGINIYISSGQVCGASWASAAATPVNVCQKLVASTAMAYSLSFYFSKNATTNSLYVSGYPLVTATIPNTALTASTTNVGIGGNAGTTKYTTSSASSAVSGFLGTIVEFIQYSSTTAAAVLTDAQVRSIHGYLNAKYSLTMPWVTISAAVASVGENDANAKGYLVSRSFPTSSALTVYYTVSGTAVAGTNYTALPGSVSIPAYNTSVYTGLTPKNNAVYTTNSTVDTKTLTLTLANDAGAGTNPVTYFIASPSAASTNIVDYVAPTSATIVSWLNGELGVSTFNGTVSTWTDQTGNAISATSSGGQRPTSVSASPSYIQWSGSNNMTVATNALLDSAATYAQKTFALVFRTGSSVTNTCSNTTQQIIYKQGSSTNGLNISICNSLLYFSINNSGWGTSPNYISRSVAANTLYAAIFEYDGTNAQIRGRVNRTTITPSTTGVGSTLTGVASSTGLGGVRVSSVRFFDNSTSSTANSNFLSGSARTYEIILFNGTLSSNDYSTLETYLLTKYGL